MALLEPDRALAEILECVLPLPPESISIEESLGRHLSGDILAKRSQPFADNSAMDGYAVRASDLSHASIENPVALKLVGMIRAGDAPDVSAAAGEVVRIFTGALVPGWADAVVMQEQTRSESAESEKGATVHFLATAQEGQNIRRAGEEYAPGDCLLAKGSRIREAGIGLLAGDGTTRVEVFGCPRVAVIGTGNELVSPKDAERSPQSVVDGNTPMLVAAAGALGAEVVMAERVGDEAQAVADCLRKAIKSAHVVLTTGGASVGEFDVIPEAWESAGIETLFWKVAIKPGKPLRFGVYRREDEPDTLVFALPGNPLSALTNFELFVHPVLRGLAGASMTRNACLHLPLSSNTRGAKDRTWFIRAALSGGEAPAIEVPKRQGSNMLREAARNALVAEFLPGISPLEEGHIVSTFISGRDLEGMSLEPFSEAPLCIHVDGEPGCVERVLRGLAPLFSSDFRFGLVGFTGDMDCLFGASLPGSGSFKIKDRGDLRDNRRALASALKAFSGETELVFVVGSGFATGRTLSVESGDFAELAKEEKPIERWRLTLVDGNVGVDADHEPLLKQLAREIEAVSAKER